MDVLKILLEAKVRGLPMPYHLESAVVGDNGDLEMETRSFPENCEVALQAANTKQMEKMETGFASSPKHVTGGARIERQDFNKPP